MLGLIISGVVGAVAGFIIGMFVYRNNKGLVKVADKVDGIVDIIKD